jgi:RNA polymerase sigma factor (sigma-70 family)
MGNAVAAGRAAHAPIPGGALRVLKDERLATMVAGGRDDAFAVLYQRHHQAIYRYCVSILHQEADARDALQSTMLAALSSLRARPIEGPLKPWLFRIAHNQSISIIRGRTREAPTDSPPPVAASDNPETREELRTLVADIGALPDRQRGAIVMRELSGLSYGEIGAALGTSAAAGKQLVYEARTALQDSQAGHEMGCDLVRERISANDLRLLRGRAVRAHLRGCQPCQDFEQAIRRRRGGFALLAPPLAPAAAAALLGDVFGHGGSAGGGAAVGGGAGGSAVGSGGLSVGGLTGLKAVAAAVVVGTAGVGAYAAGEALLTGEPGAVPAAEAEASLPGAQTQHAGAGANAGAHSRNRGAGDATGRRAAKPDAGRAAPAAAAAGENPAAGGAASPGSDVSAGGPPAPSGADEGTSGGGVQGSAEPAPTSPMEQPSPPASQDPPAPPTDPPSEPPPTGGGGSTVPLGTPPGHGGTIPGHGGIPPGQAPGDVPPGLLKP